MGRGKRQAVSREAAPVAERGEARTQLSDGDGRHRPVPVFGDKLYPAGTVLKKPQDWAAEEGYIILDPDGWRRPEDPSFDTPIPYEEYKPRFHMSTVGPLAAFTDKGAKPAQPPSPQSGKCDDHGRIYASYQNTYSVYCELPKGHFGPHREGHDSWRNTQAPTSGEHSRDLTVDSDALARNDGDFYNACVDECLSRHSDQAEVVSVNGDEGSELEVTISDNDGDLVVTYVCTKA